MIFVLCKEIIIKNKMRGKNKEIHDPRVVFVDHLDQKLGQSAVDKFFVVSLLPFEKNVLDDYFILCFFGEESFRDEFKAF